MKIIGITGAIGCGKSYVTEIISNKGFPSIDSDEVYHEMISSESELSSRLSLEFGKEILTESGGVDRKKLSEKVFSDKEKLKELNKISHGYVLNRLEDIIKEHENKGDEALFVEVPLMFESGFDKRCDFVICVVASLEKRIQRICKRNNMTEEEAKKRIENQKDNKFYIENSSFVIYNNGNEDLNAQIENVLERIFKHKVF